MGRKTNSLSGEVKSMVWSGNRSRDLNRVIVCDKRCLQVSSLGASK